MFENDPLFFVSVHIYTMNKQILFEKYGSRAMAIADALTHFSLDIIYIMAEYSYEWTCTHSFNHEIQEVIFESGHIVVSSIGEIYVCSSTYLKKYSAQGEMLIEKKECRGVYFLSLMPSHSDSYVFSLKRWISPYDVVLPIRYDRHLNAISLPSVPHRLRYQNSRCTNTHLVLFAEEHHVQSDIICINRTHPEQHLRWQKPKHLGNTLTFDVFQDSIYFFNEHSASITCHELLTGNFIQEIHLRHSDFSKSQNNRFTSKYIMLLDRVGRIYIMRYNYTVTNDNTTVYVFLEDGSYIGQFHMSDYVTNICFDTNDKMYILTSTQIKIFEQVK